MAVALAGQALAARSTAAGSKAAITGRATGIVRLVGPALESLPWTTLPLLLGPRPPSAAQALAVLAAAALFFLLDLATAYRVDGRKIAPLLFALAAGGTAAWLGAGLPLFAVLFLPLQLCARHWSGRSSALAGVFAATVAACRVDAGSLAAGQPHAWWLMLATASLAGFMASAAGPARDRTAPAGANVRVPTRQGQFREVVLVGLLAACTAGGLALLGSDERVQAVGLVGAFLPAPFLLLGVFRCGQLALAGGPASPRPSLRDRPTVLAAAGWAAALAASFWLPALR